MARRATALAAVLAGLGCGPGASSECEPATADCNEDPADGCETDLTAPQTCGDCDISCQAPTGATARCVEAVCAFDCDPGLVQCVNDCLSACPFVFDSPGEEPFEIPQGCFRVAVRAWGGGGGDGENNTSGAAGGFASAELAVNPGDPVVVAVGGAGGDGAGNTPGAGGVSGGGVGGNGSDDPGGGGGGLSGLFDGSLSVDGALVVAGGGGGSGGGSGGQVVAGAGGGVDGEDAANGLGVGGTIDAGFGPLNGGPGASRANGDGGGGGGGGWFGGLGGSSAGSDAGGGGGGSGFIAPAGENIDLEAGIGATPGNAADPDRGTAAEPGQPGLVIVTCIPE